MTMSSRQMPAGGDRAGRMPDFMIVGHPKCGTTALHHMLRRHPQIFMPDLKETWFFVPELQSRLRRPGRRPDTLEEYMQLFAPAEPEQRAGEASPVYLLSESAAARIAEVDPGARIIAILREPASFLRSLHLQFVQTHVEDQTDLRTALALEESRREGRNIPRDSVRPQTLLYSEMVKYVEQLERYRAVFPREQMLVLIYDDFRSDNEGTARRVLRFLDVDEEVPVAATEANPSVRVRSQPLHHLVQSVSDGRGPASRAVKASVRPLPPRALRPRARRTAGRKVIFAEPPPADETLALELRRRFAPEVEALSEYLDRDLVSLWGYDQLG